MKIQSTLLKIRYNEITRRSFNNFSFLQNVDLYEDKNSGVSVTIEKNNKGSYEISGLLSSNRIIHPISGATNQSQKCSECVLVTSHTVTVTSITNADSSDYEQVEADYSRAR